MTSPNKQKTARQDEEVDCTPFPQQLMEILSNEEYSGVIDWLPHGKGFIVSKKQEFATQIMPRYFKKSRKYPSFARKLTRWGFVRVSSGPEIGAYYHRYFLRDRPRLCQQIHCEQSKTKLGEENIHQQFHSQLHLRHSPLSPMQPGPQKNIHLSNEVQLIGGKIACMPEMCESTRTIGSHSKVYGSSRTLAGQIHSNWGFASNSAEPTCNNNIPLALLLANINSATQSPSLPSDNST